MDPGFRRNDIIGFGRRRFPNFPHFPFSTGAHVS